MRCLVGDSSSGNNDVFVKGRRMKTLHSTPESLSWLMRGKLSKDKNCLSLIDILFSQLILNVIQGIQNAASELKIIRKTTPLRHKKTHNFE